MVIIRPFNRCKVNHWVPIKYRDFWDFPRVFVVSHEKKVLLFDFEFDESTEDFKDFYKVYILPDLGSEDLEGSWQDLHSKALRFVEDVPIHKVRFDETRRRENRHRNL